MGLADKTREQRLLTSNEASNARPLTLQLIKHTGTYIWTWHGCRVVTAINHSHDSNWLLMCQTLTNLNVFGQFWNAPKFVDWPWCNVFCIASNRTLAWNVVFVFERTTKNLYQLQYLQMRIVFYFANNKFFGRKFEIVCLFYCFTAAHVWHARIIHIKLVHHHSTANLISFQNALLFLSRWLLSKYLDVTADVIGAKPI